MEIGLRLKLFRLAAGLKQKEVAQALDLTVNYVSMVERGRRQATLRYLQEFARVVEVPAAVFLWEPSTSSTSGGDVQELQQRLTGLMAEFAATLGAKP